MAAKENPFLKFLQSDGGSSIMSAVLGGLGNMGAQRSQERMSQEQMAEMQRQYAGDDQWRRDQLLTSQAPTGWGQHYQQQTALKEMLMQKLGRGSSFIPSNESVAAKLGANAPKPLQMSEQWQQMNPYGVDQTMQSIAQRQGVLDLLSQGRGPGFNFGASGYDPQKAQGLDDSTRQYRNSVVNSNPLSSAVNMGRDGQMPQQGGSRLGSAASGAMTGASMGSFIPGIGTGIGAGIGGLIGLMRGGGGPSTRQQITQLGGQPMAPAGRKGDAMQQVQTGNNALLQQLMAQRQSPQASRNPYL